MLYLRAKYLEYDMTFFVGMMLCMIIMSSKNTSNLILKYSLVLLLHNT